MKTTALELTSTVPKLARPRKCQAFRRRALIQATEKATRIGRAFAVGKVLLAYRVLRENQLIYDGQDFFDNAPAPGRDPWLPISSPLPRPTLPPRT